MWMYFFFFNDTATTEIYTLSLHDALPILEQCYSFDPVCNLQGEAAERVLGLQGNLWTEQVPTMSHCEYMLYPRRSEEHTSELQSRQYLVCRLLLEKKKKLFYKF